MENGHETGLIQAIKAFRKVYDHQHQHVPEAERELGWTAYWNTISAQATGQIETSRVTPSKRPASNAAFGMEPASKRPGLVGTPLCCSTLQD
jgi:hypothetical protein